MAKTPSRAEKYRERAADTGASTKGRTKSERGPLRKKQKALNDMADNEDWLDGKSTSNSR